MRNEQCTIKKGNPILSTNIAHSSLLIAHCSLPLVEYTGVEPVTSALRTQRSGQLS